jgi:hypothetical protein
MELAALIIVIIVSLGACVAAGITTYYVIKEWRDYKEEKYQEHLQEGKKNLRKKLFPKSHMNNPIYDWPLIKAKNVKTIIMPKPLGIPDELRFVYNGKTQESEQSIEV